jgi:alkanesulfonate monooxygenase SsuD/methylene tetrahydromethanopterin reductase-like flavin-dependent oxidoreductase (luciferase family)
MLDEGLAVLTGLLSGEPVDHAGEFYAARGGVRFRPAPAVPLWLAGRYGNPAPLRRAAAYDGFFVIGLGGPDDLARVTEDLAARSPESGFDVVVDLLPDQDPGPWLDNGATWVLTRVGPYDIDLEEAMRLAAAGPGSG